VINHVYIMNKFAFCFPGDTSQSEGKH